ncbi:hypothetical protein BCR43DRAFT_382798 [Syncephalastrum racemosum]|uniref:Uncharacterized protein n=1 Tax=Syncephalastrum racemosum TaxID=13706 RepID=A0A1X2H6M5_SYNRA|nr:hypothetical protein BCR43DRAFT_382798 [Syncephalastrum racemosum]
MPTLNKTLFDMDKLEARSRKLENSGTEYRRDHKAGTYSTYSSVYGEQRPLKDYCASKLGAFIIRCHFSLVYLLEARTSSRRNCYARDSLSFCSQAPTSISKLISQDLDLVVGAAIGAALDNTQHNEFQIFSDGGSSDIAYIPSTPYSHRFPRALIKIKQVVAKNTSWVAGPSCCSGIQE